VLIDLDFKYPFERAIQRQFDVSDVHKFIQNYVETLKHFYDLSDKTSLRFFISLRPAPYDDKKANSANRSIKDGVHIECPDMILHSEHQQVLRHHSLEMGIVSDSFGHTGYVNSEKDIFDEAIVKKNGWFFYGESKPDIPAYNLVSVYTYYPYTDTFEEQDATDYETRQLMELLSIRYNLEVDSIQINEDIQDEWKKRLDYCNGKRDTQKFHINL
jgi:hypothetical protein